MKAVLAGASTIALMSALATQALAQAAPAPAGDDAVEAIIVTGTRTTGLRAVDSPAPVQVLDTGALTRVGQPDLMQAIAQNVPSFTAQAFGGDTAALTLSAKLRGVSPNHALVLINGKRRHGTANLAVLGGAYQGNASADLSLIPLASIDHIEVLQDGAAAQYGTDAIAGVINIIQKKSARGGSIAASGGQYMDGGGLTGDLSANLGFAPNDKSFLNVTAETKYHGFSFRGDIDPRVVDSIYNAGATNSPAKSYPQITGAQNYPYPNRVSGDAMYRLNVVTYNAGYDVNDNLSLYSFGSYGSKSAQAHENYRLPNVVVGRMAGDIPFPLGFDPREQIKEQDFALTGGANGKIGGWSWDLSSTYGKDKDSVNVINTANADLYKDTSTTTTKGYSPSAFHNGDFIATQWTNTLDINHEYNVGWAEPVTFAAGGEYREDTYEIVAGDPGSYYKGGPQAFYGYSPTDAGFHKRHNWAVYGDIAASPIEALKLDGAIRHEDFSDFGGTTVFKGTGRFDFNDAIAIRGTASTGFRAPTMAEGFYSGINVGPSTIGGQLPPNSPGAKLLGIDGLKPEKSTNFSAGFVAHPISRLTMTVDAYQIKIKDRIVGSGTLYGDNSNKNILRSPAVLAALTANGVVIDQSIFTNTSWSIGAALFTNGLDTRTRGIDFLTTYSSDFGDYGRVDWTVSANYNKTVVTRIAPPPSQLTAGVTLFDKTAISNLENTSPKYRIVLSGLWTMGRWGVLLKESFYGKSSQYTLDSFDATYRLATVHAALTTDLEVSYSVIRAVKVTIGANNLFNKYPDKGNDLVRQHQLQQNSNGYSSQYSTFSPYGINGGYYYGKVSYTF